MTMPNEPLKLAGQVVTGLGDYGQWIAKYGAIYKCKTGLDLFPGTLNIQLDEDYVFPTDCERIEECEYGGQVSVSLMACRVFSHRAVLLRTDANRDGTGPHPLSLVEVAAGVKFREEYELQDGDWVTIEIPGNSEVPFEHFK